MSARPRPGGMRKGTRFEEACQDLFEKMGYTAIFENEEFECKYPRKHGQGSHEIDFLFRFEKKTFLRPWCSAGRPLVECQKSLKKPATGEDKRKLAQELLNKIECARAYGYKVTCGIIATNSALPDFPKLSKNIFIWDQSRMTYYAYKIFKSKDMESTLFSLKERKICNGTSFLWAVQKHEKQKHYLHNIGVFFDKTTRERESTQVNVADLTLAMKHIKCEINKHGLQPATVYADLFSLSGFTRSIYGKKDSLGKDHSRGKIEVIIERVLDIETTPWWALIR